MNQSNVTSVSSSISFLRCSGLFLLLGIMLSLSACISSTKVYNTDKTITYNGTLYNMANVQKISNSVVGTRANGDEVNLRNMDKKEITALIKEESDLLVTTTVTLDDQALVYQNGRVDRYSKYSSMVKKFDGALKDISKFMANKKKTQLKLK